MQFPFLSLLTPFITWIFTSVFSILFSLYKSKATNNIQMCWWTILSLCETSETSPRRELELQQAGHPVQRLWSFGMQMCCSHKQRPGFSSFERKPTDSNKEDGIKRVLSVVFFLGITNRNEQFLNCCAIMPIKAHFKIQSFHTCLRNPFLYKPFIAHVYYNYK